MKKFRVTLVEKSYTVVDVEAESVEEVESIVDKNFDSFFSGEESIIDHEDVEVFYDEVTDETEKGVQQ